MPQISGNQVLRTGGRRAFEESIVVLIGRYRHSFRTTNPKRASTERPKHRFRPLMPGAELVPEQNLPVFCPHLFSYARQNTPIAGPSHHLRLQPQRLQTSGNQHVGIENYAHR